MAAEVVVVVAEAAVAVEVLEAVVVEVAVAVTAVMTEAGMAIGHVLVVPTPTLLGEMPATGKRLLTIKTILFQ